MTVEIKDLRLLKNDYSHRVKAVEMKIFRIEKRVEWLEKLLWLSAGAVISWLVAWAIRSV
jgi:hypothetical protein